MLAPLTVRNLRHYSSHFHYVSKFVATQGWNPSAEALLGRVYYFTGDFERSEKMLRAAVDHEREPRKSARRLELAEVYLKTERFDAARNELVRIPEDSPVREKAARKIREIDRLIRIRQH